MKRIIKTQLEDKPYKLLFNDLIKESYLKHAESFNDCDLQDIYISQGQKNLICSRSRGAWLCCYVPLSVFKDLLNDLRSQIDLEFAYCYHDCDIYNSSEEGHVQGELKKPHIHALLLFSSPVSLSVIAYHFHTLSVQPHSDFDISYRWNYLIHDSEQCRKDKKYQYSKTDRICSNEEFFLSRCCSRDSSERALKMYDDFLRGRSYRELVAEFGFSFISNFRNLKYLCEHVSRDSSVFPIDSTPFDEG